MTQALKRTSFCNQAEATILMRGLMIWALLALVVFLPLLAALSSPLLAWRDPIYIAAGISGLLAMMGLLLQPLLAMGRLPGLPGQKSRHLHRWIGLAVVISVVGHVAGLWITSPPDVVDALLLASPTPFSIWGVIAMWGVFATVALAGMRHRLRLNPRHWQLAHTSLALAIVLGSAVHAILIEGTMEPLTKAALCLAALVATLAAVTSVWRRLFRTRANRPSRIADNQKRIGAATPRKRHL